MLYTNGLEPCPFPLCQPVWCWALSLEDPGGTLEEKRISLPIGCFSHQQLQCSFSSMKLLQCDFFSTKMPQWLLQLPTPAEQVWLLQSPEPAAALWLSGGFAAECGVSGTTRRQPKRQAEGHQCDSSLGAAPCTRLMALQWVCGIALPCGGHPLAPLQQVYSKFHLQQFCHLPSRETWVQSGSQSLLGWAYHLVSYLRPGNSSCSLHLLFLCSLKFSLFLISQCSIMPIYYI